MTGICYLRTLLKNAIAVISELNRVAILLYKKVAEQKEVVNDD